MQHNTILVIKPSNGPQVAALMKFSGHITTCDFINTGTSNFVVSVLAVSTNLFFSFYVHARGLDLFSEKREGERSLKLPSVFVV